MHVLQVAGKPESVINFDWRLLFFVFFKDCRVEQIWNLCDLEICQIAEGAHTYGNNFGQDQRSCVEVKYAQQPKQRAVSTQAEHVVKVLVGLEIFFWSFCLRSIDVENTVFVLFVHLYELLRVKHLQFDDADTLTGLITSYLLRAWHFVQLLEHPTFDKNALNFFDALLCLIWGYVGYDHLNLLKDFMKEFWFSSVYEYVLKSILGKRVGATAIMLALTSESKADTMVVIVSTDIYFHYNFTSSDFFIISLLDQTSTFPFFSQM